MANIVEENDLAKFIVVGDRALIKPKEPQSRTKSGLYLPPGVKEREQVQSGYIMKVGPGYPVPSINDMSEPWQGKNGEANYIPLQAREGDLAIYLQNSTYEIEFNNEKYVIVSQSSILMLIRDEGLFT